MEAKLKAWQRNDERSIRLNTIPGIGPIGSALLIMKTPVPELFQSGRQFAAWIGLDAKGSLDCRQAAARLYHASRR